MERSTGEDMVVVSRLISFSAGLKSYRNGYLKHCMGQGLVGFKLAASIFSSTNNIKQP